MQLQIALTFSVWATETITTLSSVVSSLFVCPDDTVPFTEGFQLLALVDNATRKWDVFFYLFSKSKYNDCINGMFQMFIKNP